MYCVNQSFGDADDDRSDVLNWDQVTGAGRQKPSVGGARSQLPGDLFIRRFNHILILTFALPVPVPLTWCVLIMTI